MEMTDVEIKDADEEKTSQAAESENVEMADVEMKEIVENEPASAAATEDDDSAGNAWDEWLEPGDTTERAPQPTKAVAKTSELRDEVSDLKEKLRKARKRIHSERKHRKKLEEENESLKGRLTDVEYDVKILKDKVVELEDLVKNILGTQVVEESDEEFEEGTSSDEEEWSPDLCKGQLLDDEQPQTQADPNPMFLTRENIANFEAIAESEEGAMQFFHDYEGDLPTQMSDWSSERAKERVEFVNQQIGILAADHSRWSKQELDKWCAPVICGDIPSIDRCVFVVELNAKLIFGRGEESKEDEEDWRWMTLVPVFFHATNEEYTWRLLNYPGNNIPRRAVQDVDWTLAKRIRGFRQK